MFAEAITFAEENAPAFVVAGIVAALLLVTFWPLRAEADDAMQSAFGDMPHLPSSAPRGKR